MPFTEIKTDTEEDIPLSTLREEIISELYQQMELVVNLLIELDAHDQRLYKFS